jgi:hypothetical protein
VERRLRYSERKRLAEEGSLGQLTHDEVPEPLAVAVIAVLEQANAKQEFLSKLTTTLVEHFGLNSSWLGFAYAREPDNYLDFLEVACEVGRSRRTVIQRRAVLYYPGLEERLNQLLDRHRFGFRIEGGEARKIGSPALDAQIVGPTLLAVQRPGWEQVETSFKKALSHQRGGEVDDALTAANASVEAALKAIGMPGATMGALAGAYKQSATAPGYLRGVPELLEDLLGKLMAARSVHGDAHGKSPGAVPGDGALADLALYWAGAFVLYLSETNP